MKTIELSIYESDYHPEDKYFVCIKYEHKNLDGFPSNKYYDYARCQLEHYAWLFEELGFTVEYKDVDHNRFESPESYKR